MNVYVTDVLTTYTQELVSDVMDIYNKADTSLAILWVVRTLDSIGAQIVDNATVWPTYTPDGEGSAEALELFLRELQLDIDHIAAPSVGRDRQAIALGCLRDFITATDIETQLDNLSQCRVQLIHIYNAITPMPF